MIATRTTGTEMDPAARERLLEAALSELEMRGRGAMDLADLLRGTKVEAADFEAEYGDLDRCLAAAYDHLTARLDAAVRVACSTAGGPLGTGEPGGWPERVRAGLEALLVELAASPGMARALTRSYPSLGGEQQASYQRFVERLAGELRVRREMGGVDGELPADVDGLAVGAAEAIVFEEISTGRTEQLPGMVPSILFSVLVPYLGAGGARAEMERAAGSR